MKPVMDSKELLIAAQNRPPTDRASRAFNLIELLVVIAIIGILAAVLFAVRGPTKAKAQNAACVNNLRELGIGARLYTGDNSGRLPCAERLPTKPADPQKPFPRICDLLARYIAQGAGTNADPASTATS